LLISCEYCSRSIAGGRSPMTSYSQSAETLLSVHADQNIMLYSLPEKQLKKQLIGYNDEIVDSTFLRPISSSQASLLALATNSSLIRLYSPETLDARLLQGHSDIVLALDRSGDGRLLASGSKDKEVRIWAPQQHGDGTSSWGYSCVAVCKGHAESVGAVAMSRISELGDGGPRFVFTGSQDRTIKMWDLTSISSTVETQPVQCKSLTTHKAHEKDINSLDVSPNDKLLVSGSQDRTAKIYAIEYTHTSAGPRGELRVLGTCKGHKRGVWAVRFCRTNRVLATGSGDKSIKLWNLDDFSCIKTFEGHTNSVLRVDFYNAGMQLVSTASDGLVKVWGIQDEECHATLDNHEDKVRLLFSSCDVSSS
jgi:U3 small nucleolar RNA-associated protein 13